MRQMCPRSSTLLAHGATRGKFVEFFDWTPLPQSPLVKREILVETGTGERSPFVEVERFVELQRPDVDSYISVTDRHRDSQSRDKGRALVSFLHRISSVPL